MFKEMNNIKQSGNINKIICFHTLNNFSGSPLVLSVVLRGLVEKGYNIELFTSKTKGLLSDIDDINYFPVYYRWSQNKIVLLILFLYSQLRLFIDVYLKYRKEKNSKFYINTITPWGATLAGKLLGAEIIYHCHEVYLNPNLINKIGKYIKDRCADKVICVSKFVADAETIIKDKSVVYNGLDNDYIARVTKYLSSKPNLEGEQLNILMISSLKEYKGIYQLLEVSRLMPSYKFTFVAGACKSDVDSFITNNKIPGNLEIFSEQTDVHPFYQSADVLINLSIPTLCQETFGMTLLEGMAYGLPVIAPPVGGPIEIVDNAVNGFCVDSSNTNEVIKMIMKITESDQTYHNLSVGAINTSKRFSANMQLDGIVKIFER
jgi:glycosyltransferase involved in cell wall biosynthesis